MTEMRTIFGTPHSSAYKKLNQLFRSFLERKRSLQRQEVTNLISKNKKRWQVHKICIHHSNSTFSLSISRSCSELKTAQIIPFPPFQSSSPLANSSSFLASMIIYRARRSGCSQRGEECAERQRALFFLRKRKIVKYFHLMATKKFNIINESPWKIALDSLAFARVKYECECEKGVTGRTTTTTTTTKLEGKMNYDVHLDSSEEFSLSLTQCKERGRAMSATQ